MLLPAGYYPQSVLLTPAGSNVDSITAVAVNMYLC